MPRRSCRRRLVLALAALLLFAGEAAARVPFYRPSTPQLDPPIHVEHPPLPRASAALNINRAHPWIHHPGIHETFPPPPRPTTVHPQRPTFHFPQPAAPGYSWRRPGFTFAIEAPDGRAE